MKLSIVMMIKNESKYLERCLMSIKPIQAAVQTELIVVDTGSTDNSLEIAEKYTDKIYSRPWNNDFAAMRNITVSYAEGEWIFVLDGDEIIEKPEDFINFFRSNKSNKYNTGIIRMRNYTQEDETKYSLSLLPRLFKKNKDFKYVGAIHEQPEIKGPIYYFKEDILHYGYISNDVELMERKFFRNTQILKSELEKDPKNIYYWFQLAQSYATYGDFEEALEANLMSYELAKEEGKLAVRMFIYTHLALVYFSNKKYEEAEKTCLEAIAVKDGYIDLYYLLAKSQQNLFKNVEAINNYQTYLYMLDHYEDFAGSKDISVTSCTFDSYEYAYADLCVLYFKEKQYEKVLEYKEKVHTYALLPIALYSIIGTYIKLKRYTDLKEFYDAKILAKYEKLTNDFTNILESEISNLNKQEKNIIMDIFSNGESVYSLLNTIRIQNKLEEISPNIIYIEKIVCQDFNKLPIYYGELFYYLLKCRYLSVSIMMNFRDNVLEGCFSYLIIRYKKVFADNLLVYLEEEIFDDTIDNIRIRKVIGKVLLLSGIFKNSENEQIFMRYIQDGIKYINYVYNDNIILNERINDLKSEEDMMLIYMKHAEEIKNIDKVEYIRYLKKAVNIYPSMAKGIEVITQKIEKDMRKQESVLNSNKEETKEKIKTLIDTGNLLQAHKLIHKYEGTYKNDMQIFSMKAVVAIMEDRLNEAEAIINEGLSMNDNDLDLLYNLKYIYEYQGEIDKAEVVQAKIESSM